MLLIALSVALAASPCLTTPPADAQLWRPKPTGADVYQGDFTGDGVGDLLLVPGLQDAEVWAGGPGGFSLAITHTPTDWPTNIQVVDLNADGLDDLAMFDWRDDELTVYSSTGTALASSYTLRPGGTIDHFVSVGDVNGDGIADLGVYLPDEDSVLVYASTTASPPPVFAVLDTAPDTSLLQDVDHDGLTDRRDGSSIFLGAGPTLTLDTGPNFGFIQHLRVVGDLDGDGLDDVVVVGDGRSDSSMAAHDTWLAVLLLRFDGPSERVVEWHLASTFAPTDAAFLGDRDGNGRPEIAVSSASIEYDDEGYTGLTYAGQVETWEVGPTSAQVVQLSHTASATRCGVGRELYARDFDGDGGIDLVSVEERVGFDDVHGTVAYAWFGPPPPGTSEPSDPTGTPGDTGPRPSTTGDTGPAATTPSPRQGTAGGDEGCGCSQGGSARWWRAFARR